MTASEVPTKEMFEAYEEIARKNSSARHDSAHWRLFRHALGAAQVVSLPKQISFVTALTQAAASAEEAMLVDMAEAVDLLRTRFRAVFHPPLDSIVTLVSLAPLHLPFLLVILQFLDDLLALEPPRKRFEIAVQKLFPAAFRIREHCPTVDRIMSEALFSPSAMTEFRVRRDVGGPADAKRPRLQSYTTKLVDSLTGCITAAAVVFDWFLEASRRHPEENAAASDITLATTIIDLVADADLADGRRNSILASLFGSIHRHRIYHPNRDQSGVLRVFFSRHLDRILSGDNASDPQSAFQAIRALLRIDHLFIEERLSPIWNLISAHRHLDDACILAADLVIAYLDLRQIAVVLKSFVDADVPDSLSSLVDSLPTLMNRVPIPQLPIIIADLITFLSSSQPAVVTDLFVVVLDAMTSQIADLYPAIISALNSAPNLPLNDRIGIYTAARRCQARRHAFTMLPDQIIAEPFDFLHDLDHVDHNLSKLFSSSLSPSMIQAGLFCLDQISSRSIHHPLAAFIASRLISSGGDIILDHSTLLLQHADQDAITLLADQIVTSDLKPLSDRNSLCENAALRGALVPAVMKTIVQRPVLLEALADLPPDYLDHVCMQPIAAYILDQIPITDRIWTKIAILSNWPLMQMKPHELLPWLLSPISPASVALLRLILQNRLSALAAPATKAVMELTPSDLKLDLLSVVVEAIVAHLHRLHSQCAEAVRSGSEPTTFEIDEVFYSLMGSIAGHVPETINSSSLNLISHLIRFRAASSSKFTSSRSLSLMAIARRIPDLIPIALVAPSFPSSELFMAAIASAVSMLDDRQLLLDSIFSFLLQNPSPIIARCLVDALKSGDFELIIGRLRLSLTTSKESVRLLGVLCMEIRDRPGHCQVIERNMTGLLSGLAMILTDHDYGLDPLLAILNHVPSASISTHQTALILQALSPAISRSSDAPVLSKILFALVRYRHQVLAPSMALFVQHAICLLRCALLMETPSPILLDNVSRVFVELARMKATAPLAARLVHDYCRAMATEPMLKDEARQAAVQGLMALLAVADREQIQAAHAALDPMGQSLFQTCHKEFLRAHKYYGRS